MEHDSYGKHNPWTRWEHRDNELKETIVRHNDEHLEKDNEEQLRVEGAGADHMGGKTPGRLNR